MEWQVFLKQRIKGFHREDYWWAALIAEVRRSWSAKPQQVRMEDFLLSFEEKKKPVLSAAERSALSRAAWLGAFGIKDPLNQNTK